MYDPTYSTTFAAIVRAADVSDPADMDWSMQIRVASELMDDDIREDLSGRDWTKYRNGDLEFLLAYMERHEAQFGSHFEWS